MAARNTRDYYSLSLSLSYTEFAQFRFEREGDYQIEQIRVAWTRLKTGGRRIGGGSNSLAGGGIFPCGARWKFIVHRGCIKYARFPAVSSTSTRRGDIIYSRSRSLPRAEERENSANFSNFWRRHYGHGWGRGGGASRWEGGKQSSDETVYLDGCATHGGASERATEQAPVPDVNLAVSLIDAAPETLLREEKFPKELGAVGKRA